MDIFFGRKRHFYASVRGDFPARTSNPAIRFRWVLDEGKSRGRGEEKKTDKIAPHRGCVSPFFASSVTATRICTERFGEAGKLFSRLDLNFPPLFIRHLIAVINVNAHDLAAVLPLAGHEVEVRLIRLGRRAHRIVHALRAPVMVPTVLRVVTVLDRCRVSGTGRAWETVGRPGSDHSIGPLDRVGTIHTSHAVAGHLPGPRQTGYRRRRRLLLRLERLKREVRIRAGSIILPGITGDQTFLQKNNVLRMRRMQFYKIFFYYFFPLNHIFIIS